MINPIGKKYLQHFLKNRVETTFQNATLVEDLNDKHYFKSVVMVTSNYHMFRSYFLLKLHLSGRCVLVKPWLVEVGSFGSNPLNWSNVEKKRIFNEMIKLWGSVAEMVHYHLPGRLRYKGLQRNKVFASLR